MNRFVAWFIDTQFSKRPRLRRFVTRLVSGDKDQWVDVAGVPLLVNTLREHGYYRAARRAATSTVFTGELAIVLNLASLIHDCDVFVDVGANVGLYASQLSRFRAINPALEVVAVEADPDTVLRLRKNGERHGFRVIHAAVSDRDGTLEFVRGAVSNVTMARERQGAFSIPGETFTVEARRLDSLDIGGRRMMIKIDVEGLELEAMRGAQAWFDEGRVRVVYVDGYADPGVVTFLAERGFAFRDGRTLAKGDGRHFALLALHEAGGT